MCLNKQKQGFPYRKQQYQKKITMIVICKWKSHVSRNAFKLPTLDTLGKAIQTDLLRNIQLNLFKILGKTNHCLSSRGYIFGFLLINIQSSNMYDASVFLSGPQNCNCPNHTGAKFVSISSMWHRKTTSAWLTKAYYHEFVPYNTRGLRKNSKFYKKY